MTRKIMAKRNNPNGANQWVADPRQQLFVSYYLNPDSDTWSNAHKSALKAGYAEEYAQSITAQGTSWFSESISDNSLILKATKNLESALVGGLDDPEKGGKPLQMRATEFVLKGLQKNKWGDKPDQQNNFFVKEITIVKANDVND